MLLGMYRAGRDLGPLGGKWLVLIGPPVHHSPGSWWRIRLYLQVLSSFLERQGFTSTRAPSCLETNPLRRNRRNCGSENRGAECRTAITYTVVSLVFSYGHTYAYTEGNLYLPRLGLSHDLPMRRQGWHSGVTPRAPPIRFFDVPTAPLHLFPCPSS